MRTRSYFCCLLSPLLMSEASEAQSIRYMVETLAGRDIVHDGGPAKRAVLRGVSRIAFDGRGRLWIADAAGHRVRVISPADATPSTSITAIAQGTISTVAGVGIAAFSGDGGPAVEAHLAYPSAVAFDTKGNTYVTDRGNGRVRKIDAAGRITTVAGGGSAVAGTEGIAATEVQLQSPVGVIVTEDSTLLFAESVGRVRSVSPEGVIRTVSGAGSLGLEANGGPAREARLLQPVSLARDARGNLYIGEEGRYCIRKISPDGVISTVAGTGTSGDEGDGGPADRAQLRQPLSIAFDSTGQLFILAGGRIRIISADGIIRTLVDSTPALSGMATLALDGSGILWAGGMTQVMQVEHSTLVQVIGGTTPCREKSAALECLVSPTLLTADSDGLIYFLEGGLSTRIAAIDRGGILWTFYQYTGSSSVGEGGLLSAAGISSIRSIFADSRGDFWVGDQSNNRVRKVTRWDGIIRTIAGNGQRGLNGDGGPAVEAQLSDTGPIAVDADGGLFLVNYPKVRKVGSDGRIRTVAGSGQRGYSGDDGPAIEANLEPSAIAVDRDGGLLIAEALNRRVRMVSPTGVIRTVAGGGSGTGDGPATEQAISAPLGVAGLPGGGFVFSTATAIYAVNADGWLERIGGGDLPGYSGDGGPALEARMNPSQLWAQTDGAILFLDSGNQRIRRLVPVTGNTR